MKLVCAGVARGSIFAAGGVAYIYTPELYPTEIRARGTSAAYACARVGGFFSSYFMFGHLPTRVKIFTLVAVAVGAASLTSFIPKETAGKDMTEQASAKATPPAKSWSTPANPAYGAVRRDVDDGDDEREGLTAQEK